MYVSSQNFRALVIQIFGHWLSKVNTLEMKDFRTHLVLVLKILNSKGNISTKRQNTDFWFRGLKAYTYLPPGKVPFAAVPNIRLAR